MPLLSQVSTSPGPGATFTAVRPAVTGCHLETPEMRQGPRSQVVTQAPRSTTFLPSETSGHRVKFPQTQRMTGVLRIDTKHTTHHTPLGPKPILSGQTSDNVWEGAVGSRAAWMRGVMPVPLLPCFHPGGRGHSQPPSAPHPQPDTVLCSPTAAPSPRMSKLPIIAPAVCGASFQ